MMDGETPAVFCGKCRAKQTPWQEWADSLKAGDLVYLYRYAAWKGLCRSQYLISDRAGQDLTVQVLGIPESRMTVDVTCCTQTDLNAWNQVAMY